MKKIKILVIITLFISGLESSYSQTNIALKKIPVEEIFIPIGFDSNDTIEISITGRLPDICYQAPQATTVIIQNQINIKIEAKKYQNKNYCPEMTIPFVKTVNLGVLNKGNYKINVNYKLTSNLYIAESSGHAIDNSVYANVEYIERIQRDNFIHLKGYNPSDCYELDEVEIRSNQMNTYSILPKLKQISEFCPMKMIPFDIEVEIPEVIKKHKILIHVRAMNGKSINALFFNYNYEQ